MKQINMITRALFISLILTVGATIASAQTTEFVYQGQLQNSSSPANGSFDFEFLLFDQLPTGGNQQGSTLTRSGVTVTNGIFAVKLDFGSQFPGAPRFLEIHVRQTGGGAFIPLTPRQAVSNAPYSVKSLNADNATNATTATTATNATQLGGVAANQYVLTSDSRLTDSRAPTAGSNSYIQNGSSAQAGSNFNITGNGAIAGTLTAGSLIGNGSGVTNVPGTFKWQAVVGTSQQAVPNNGYVASNAALVTVTLPTAPNVGDTIRVSGAGAGGWKIAQNAGQRILAPNFLVGNFTRPENWSAVASSADGTKLIALDSDGDIFTSTDSGASFTPQVSPPSNFLSDWTGVASSTDGSKLVAVAFGDFIITSTDSGVNWTTRDSQRSWASVASSSDGSKLVAVEAGGQIYTSTDSGANWTPRDSNRNWASVTSSADGSKLVAVVNGGQIYTSTNSGANWTPRDSSRGWTSVASSADGTKLVAAVTIGQIYTSTDSGATWTPRESNRPWGSVASSSDGSKLVAAVGTQLGGIYTSTDSGATWTLRQSSRIWAAIASSVDGTKLVAVAIGGETFTSTDSGVTWIPASPSTLLGTAGALFGGKSTAVELVYIGGGTFLPLSHEGTLIAN